MSLYSVAEAKNCLPRLIDKARAGEQVIITRHGKPVAELRMTDAPAQAADAARLSYEDLMRRRDSLPASSTSTLEILRLQYTEDYRHG